MADPKPRLVAQDDGAVRKRNRAHGAGAGDDPGGNGAGGGSGSGEHCTFFAERFGVPWQPGDSDLTAPRLDRCMVRGNGNVSRRSMTN